jgi:hypothetical protein
MPLHHIYSVDSQGTRLNRTVENRSFAGSGAAGLLNDHHRAARFRNTRRRPHIPPTCAVSQLTPEAAQLTISLGRIQARRADW